jgi:hypothetical protein
MRQLSKWESYVMLLGGLLMVVGAGANVLFCSWAPYVFAPGCLLFVAMQLRQRYEGKDFTIRRLRRIQIISDVLFLLAGLLMIANKGNFLGISYITYIEYVYNKWVITLLIAALLQLYSTHRIGIELEKEAKKL